MADAETRRRVLMTGAAGRVAQLTLPMLAQQYDLTLTDLRPLPRAAPAPFACADIAEPEQIRPLLQGIDTVLHLAAANMHASWDALVASNVTGLRCILEAARAAGCRRVVFSSSIQAVDGYPPDTVVHPSMPVRPSSLYGATKAWGEALAARIARDSALSIICLRLGRVTTERTRRGSLWLNRVLTPRDLIQLVIAAIEAPPELRSAVLHGASNNRYQRLDISETCRVLGSLPQDDAYRLARGRGRWLAGL